MRTRAHKILTADDLDEVLRASLIEPEFATLAGDRCAVDKVHGGLSLGVVGRGGWGV